MISWMLQSWVARCFSNSSILSAKALFAPGIARRRANARTTKTLNFYRFFRVKHRRGHDCAVFGECIGERAPAAMSFS